MKTSTIIVVVCLCVLSAVFAIVVIDLTSAPPPEKDPAEYAQELATVHTEQSTGSESSTWEFYPLFDDARAYYSENTDEEISQAVYQIYDARAFWPQLTILESLRLLVNGVPGKREPNKNVRVAADQIYSQLRKSYSKTAKEVEAYQRRQQRAIAKGAAERRQKAERERRQATRAAAARREQKQNERAMRVRQDEAARKSRRRTRTGY